MPCCEESRVEELTLVRSIVLAFGQLGKLHSGPPLLFEEHGPQDLLEVGLVRAENFQVSFDLHHRRPR